MPLLYIFVTVLLSVSSESNGYGSGTSDGFVGSLKILMYPRIEPSIDFQECFLICMFYYVRSMQNY